MGSDLRFGLWPVRPLGGAPYYYERLDRTWFVVIYLGKEEPVETEKIGLHLGKIFTFVSPWSPSLGSYTRIKDKLGVAQLLIHSLHWWEG